MVQKQALALFGLLPLRGGLWCRVGNGSIKKGRKMKDETTFDESQEKAIGDCYDRLARITHKQGFVIPFHTFYGDGTLFPKLTRKGVATVYESAMETWKEEGIISCTNTL